MNAPDRPRPLASEDRLFTQHDFVLQSGVVLPRVTLGWQTFGQLNAARDNVIVYPTSYSARHGDLAWLIEAGVLDASRWFIVVPDLLGNGISTSPSHGALSYSAADGSPQRGFPLVTYYDNVELQRRMLAEVYGIDRIALVYGWSMGGMTAWHWAAAHPEMVERIAAVCATARCSTHNRMFIEGVRAALQADADCVDGWFDGPGLRGLEAMARVYASWCMSQDWYRESGWLEGGYASLDDFLQRSWIDWYRARNPNDLLAQFATWHAGDIGAHARFGGSTEAALHSIRARVLLMPGETDLYFRVEDNRREAALLRNATLAPIPSYWGHRAGNPRQGGTDLEFIRAQVQALLAAR
ncbi:alpha/beta fold hydrolase [Derxia lacustris]|uniref:alpha/beta fold hydrolase n=1 Tax=Derxia lacustris TaxID=764842 RepID=UPI000A170AFF|nr:alpha/beta fold hydrolase [Derxia lacustris]